MKNVHVDMICMSIAHVIRGLHASIMIRKTLFRSVPALAVSVAVLAVSASGCTTLKRNAISRQFEDWFSVAVPEGTELTKIGDGFYSYRWLGYRTAFLATPDGVIVFDPLNRDAAAALAKEIERVAPNPRIAWVLYSHHHRDHASGASALPGSPRILAHTNAARDIREYGHEHEDVTPPTDTFDGAIHERDLLGIKLRFHHLVDAHTDGLVAIEVPSQRALYLVDMAIPGQVPPSAAVSSSFFGMKRAFADLSHVDYDVLVPGHGPLGTKADVAKTAQYLDDLETAMRASLHAHAMDDFHTKDTFVHAKKELASVFFEVEDQLRPKYESLGGFDQLILPTAQWCMFAILMGA